MLHELNSLVRRFKGIAFAAGVHSPVHSPSPPPPGFHTVSQPATRARHGHQIFRPTPGQSSELVRRSKTGVELGPAL